MAIIDSQGEMCISDNKQIFKISLSEIILIELIMSFLNLYFFSANRVSKPFISFVVIIDYSKWWF